MWQFWAQSATMACALISHRFEEVRAVNGNGYPRELGGSSRCSPHVHTGQARSYEERLSAVRSQTRAQSLPPHRGEVAQGRELLAARARRVLQDAGDEEGFCMFPSPLTGCLADNCGAAREWFDCFGGLPLNTNVTSCNIGVLFSPIHLPAPLPCLAHQQEEARPSSDGAAAWAPLVASVGVLRRARLKQATRMQGAR